MGTCFVIQPFDKGPFDKRYNETLSPAILETSLEPYRVDRDPGVSVIIESIQTGIHYSELILADITEDNPNVWFELGMAIESNKDIILICSSKRGYTFPFDVQHRKIIRYNTESQSDFEYLKKEIKEHIEAILTKKSNLDKLSSPKLIANTKGLTQAEILILASIAQDGPNSSVGYHRIVQDLENQGITKLATSISVRSLLKKQMIDITVESDNFGNELDTYGLADTGWEWLENNTDELVLKKRLKPTSKNIEPDDESEAPF